MPCEWGLVSSINNKNGGAELFKLIDRKLDVLRPSKIIVRPSFLCKEDDEDPERKRSKSLTNGYKLRWPSAAAVTCR